MCHCSHSHVHLIFEVRYLATVSVSRHCSVSDKTINEWEAFGWLRIGKVKRSTRRNLLSATLSTTNSTRPDLRSNRGSRGWKPSSICSLWSSRIAFTAASHRAYCYPHINNPQTDAICIVSILMASLKSELNKFRNILTSRLSLSLYFHNLFHCDPPHTINTSPSLLSKLNLNSHSHITYDATEACSLLNKSPNV
jgi:hypothetical protein